MNTKKCIEKLIERIAADGWDQEETKWYGDIENKDTYCMRCELGKKGREYEINKKTGIIVVSEWGLKSESA